MTIPTREEWKAMVGTHGYHKAVRMLDCDLDDVPGIEDTWIENFESMAPALERSERQFLEWVRVRGSWRGRTWFCIRRAFGR